jgi:hypothetical protein
MDLNFMIFTIVKYITMKEKSNYIIMYMCW